ncbi:MAG: phenylalanine--tRNA ligase subunit beta, partial [Caldilineaceae bacterium]
FYTPEGEGVYDFYDLKGVIETLLERLGFGAAQVEFGADPDVPPFGPRCAAVRLNGEVVGHVGEVHPRVRQAFDLPELRVAAAELRVAPLVRPHFQLTPMRPISAYPATAEDLAFEVDESITVRRIEQAIRTAGGFLLTEVELFDIFRGGTLPVGCKSVAFHLTWQSPDRPLVEREVAALRRRVIDAVVKETGATLRG